MQVSRFSIVVAACQIVFAGAVAASDTGRTKAAPSAKAPTAAPAGSPPATPPAPVLKEWPRILPQQGDAQGETWTAEEVQAARARCETLLKGLDVVVIRNEAMRAGQCGAAAPVELVSIGTSPQVVLSPPAVLTCEMVAAMHKWVTKDLQPLAKRFHGKPLIRIDTMSSYSCRAAYGRKGGRLSEHGRANALDIRGFVLASGNRADVLADWGRTGRDIRAEVAAAKKAADAKLAAEHTEKMQPPVPATRTPPQPLQPPQPPTAVQADSAPRFRIPSLESFLPGNQPSQEAIGLRPGEPPSGMNRLGAGSLIGVTPPPSAITPAAAPPALPEPSASRINFIRQAHKTACAIFGTVLGPEANEAHRNHFHVDMAERRSVAICE